ncbi:MAG: alpha-L-fucosidase [Clostridia bacterium]
MEKFTADFESLGKVKCPDWFRDLKFGIWSHWGPQSVPMNGDWYAKGMYIEGTSHYNYHLAHYGHPSEFGYKDICKLWKAENFNPDELMAKFYKAGARYFVGQMSHHDNFFNYDSELNRMNSVKVGPHKDICQMWKDAAEKYDMPFGLSEHLSASFSWWHTNKGCDKYGPFAGVPYDGNDPEYADFYHNNKEHYQRVDSLYIKNGNIPWYTQNEEFHKYWLKAMDEVIAKFKPDMLYTDGALPFVSHKDEFDPSGYSYGLEAVANLYNTSIDEHGENRAIYTQKDIRPEVRQVGIYDIERSQLDYADPLPWQTDTCIGGWYYNAQREYKYPEHVIEMFVDIIAKNGSLLLNIIQRPDGTIDKHAEYILDELAVWFDICSEAIYYTRPWKVCMEGATRVKTKGMSEEKAVWSDADYRFVQKENTVYAYILAPASSRVAVIKSFNEGEEIKNVRLLGFGDVEFSHNFGVLTVKLPETLPTKYTNCLAIELK